MRCLSSDLAGVSVIGMRIFPVMGKDGPRPVHANLADHPGAGLFSQPYVAVREFQVVTNGEPHLFGGRRCFGCSDLSRASCAHLSPGHVEDSDSIPFRYQLYYRAATTELGVIRMGANGKRIKLDVISHVISSYFGGYG